MRPKAFIYKCVRVSRDALPIGAIAKVTVAPEAPLETATGEITFLAYDEATLDACKVGGYFRLVVEPLKEGPR